MISLAPCLLKRCASVTGALVTEEHLLTRQLKQKSNECLNHNVIRYTTPNAY